MRAKIFVLTMAFHAHWQIGHRVSALFEANVPEQENKFNAYFRGKPHKHTHRHLSKGARNWIIV